MTPACTPVAIRLVRRLATPAPCAVAWNGLLLRWRMNRFKARSTVLLSRGAPGIRRNGVKVSQCFNRYANAWPRLLLGSTVRSWNCRSSPSCRAASSGPLWAWW